MHLIVEARDWQTLSSAIRGLEIRLARRINAMTNRRGRVIADRYHLRVLKTPTDARNAIVYVLQNAAKHGRAQAGLPVDPLSSAGWFAGWKEDGTRLRVRDVARAALKRRGLELPEKPLSEAQTWLLRFGWRKHGAISFREQPRA